VVCWQDACEIAVAVSIVLDLDAKMLNGSVNGAFGHDF
jgi:hypothetical protein